MRWFNGKREQPGFGQHAAEIFVDEFEAHVLVQALQGRRVVDVRRLDGIVGAARPEPIDQLRAEIETDAVFLVAPQADGVDVARIDAQVAAAPAEQRRQVVLRAVAVRRHPHHFVFAVEHLEAEIFSHRAVHARDRVGIVELGDLVDAAALAPTEKRRRVLAFAVDAEDRGLRIEP